MVMGYALQYPGAVIAIHTGEVAPGDVQDAPCRLAAARCNASACTSGVLFATSIAGIELASTSISLPLSPLKTVSSLPKPARRWSMATAWYLLAPGGNRSSRATAAGSSTLHTWRACTACVPAGVDQSPVPQPRDHCPVPGNNSLYGGSVCSLPGAQGGDIGKYSLQFPV